MDNNVVWKLLSVWVVQYALALTVVAAAAMADDSRTAGLSGVCESTYASKA